MFWILLWWWLFIWSEIPKPEMLPLPILGEPPIDYPEEP